MDVEFLPIPMQSAPFHYPRTGQNQFSIFESKLRSSLLLGARFEPDVGKAGRAFIGLHLSQAQMRFHQTLAAMLASKFYLKRFWEGPVQR